MVDPDKLPELQEGLAGVQAALDGVAARMANANAGHVYVISNIGSFGERMVKIGMTRRLDPFDRVRELGDASVPFRYDVHASVLAEDAVALETNLHRRFAAQRVNLVNRHREFFHATAAEVPEALKEYAGSVVVEFTDDATRPAGIRLLVVTALDIPVHCSAPVRVGCRGAPGCSDKPDERKPIPFSGPCQRSQPINDAINLNGFVQKVI